MSGYVRSWAGLVALRCVTGLVRVFLGLSDARRARTAR